MSHYADIQSMAFDCHGYFTSANARKAGIRSCELDRWVKIGRLERPARGVYRLSSHPPSPLEPYVRAALAVGPGSAIYGESVLGMLNLIPTNPSWIYVASPIRIRRKLGDGIKVIVTTIGDAENHEGIPMQRVSDAIRSARGYVGRERRMRAAEEAFRQGYVMEPEYKRLMKEIKRETAS